MKKGRFKAFALDKIITENSKGNPQAVIQLEVCFPEGNQTMNFYGQLTGGAIEHTVKALVACGLQGNNPMDPITKGKEVSAVIDEEVDDQGKIHFKVQWVNKPMGMGEPINEMKGRSSLKNLEGMIAKLRQNEPTIKNHAPQTAKDEKLPF